MLEINVTHIPFSRYGAYVALTRDADGNGLKKEWYSPTLRKRSCRMTRIRSSPTGQSIFPEM